MIEYSEFQSEVQLPEIIHLIENDLSEPYSVYTYRYFIHNWPNLCFLAKEENAYVGVIICKLDRHKDRLRGYIAMLAVAKTHRKRSIGSNLVKKALYAMKKMNADEVVLETEYTNLGALGLYQKLGFIRDKRLYRYYLNGIDAFRLKLFCKTMMPSKEQEEGSAII
ncbi:N-alpha-acetyltransferase 30 [Choanephora cucurbitarum]|uniref:N-alpha-acetyltransferase 30 n=1 Tax=Choanephora cucurbitarum TaxID=101091 RepID=A0A1C7MZ01_9FUNG|nr:N-alpha-acetyltransferase 30 [Choanephora cucurbitarum]